MTNWCVLCNSNPCDCMARVQRKKDAAHAVEQMCREDEEREKATLRAEVERLTRENAKYALAIAEESGHVQRLTRELDEERAKLVVLGLVATAHGWNGTDNSKILSVFFDQELIKRDQLRDQNEQLKAERDLRYQQALSFQESFDRLTTALFNAFGQPGEQHAIEIVERLAKEVPALRQQLAAARKDGERLEISCDRAYIDGMRTGWNFCATDNYNGYRKAMAARQSQIDAAMKEDSRG